MSAVAAPRRTLFEVRAMFSAEEAEFLFAPDGLGAQFFDESEFGTFTQLDMNRAREVLLPQIDAATLVCLVGYYKAEPVGFLLFHVSRQYTTDPMAQLYLFYVQRHRRFTPLGRKLLVAAESIAEEMGACVFYMGATANVGNGYDERLMNMLDKFGYKRLGGVARKVLT